MKIAGGSFGSTGKAWLKGGMITINGPRFAQYKPKQVAAADYRIERERRFGWGSFIVGTVLFAFLFGLVMGVFGWVLGLALGIAGSFYTINREFAELTFEDGTQVLLQLSSREARKLAEYT